MPGRFHGQGSLHPGHLPAQLQRWGHVRQLDRVSRELLARAVLEGRGGTRRRALLTIDLDHRPSARPTDWPRRAPATTAIPASGAITRCWPSPPAPATVLMARLREGRANTARGAAHFLRETVSRVRYAGASGQLTARADSGFYTRPGVGSAVVPGSAGPYRGRRPVAGWMSASPSPSASTKACGTSSRRFPRRTGRRSPTGWTAPPMWRRPAPTVTPTYTPFHDDPPRHRNPPSPTPHRCGSSSGG